MGLALVLDRVGSFVDYVVPGATGCSASGVSPTGVKRGVHERRFGRFSEDR